MGAPLRTIKPSIGTGSVDREQVRAVVAEIAAERPARDEAVLSAEREIIVLRLAAGEQVQRTSIRQVAREIGMSPMGLMHFLKGARPYPATAGKLRRWYARYAAPRDALSAEAAEAAVALLVRDLDPDVRQPVVESVLRCMEHGYRESGRDVPAWIDDLRQRFGAPGESPR